MTYYDFENGLKGEELVDFCQADYLARGEKGLCILLSGIIATNIHREMNRGRCNFFYIQSWLESGLNEASYRKMFKYSRDNKGNGKGVTSFRCQERPVDGELLGYGSVLGVYFNLAAEAHACCLLPDYCGTVALFFDPNYGLLRITKEAQGVISTDDIAGMVRWLYAGKLGGDLNLKIGRYKEHPGFYFGKRAVMASPSSEDEPTL